MSTCHIPSQVLEGTGDLRLTCSFTYDHDLHESLEISILFDDGRGGSTTLLPREGGRVAMRYLTSFLEPHHPFQGRAG